MAAAAASTPASDAELRHDGADLVAELRRAVESLAERPPAAREAVRRVVEALLLEEEGASSPFAPTLHAALAAVEPTVVELRPAPQETPEPAGQRVGWKRLAALAFTFGS